MNIMYLSLYGVAAVVLAVVFIRTCLERDKMTRIVCLTEMLALICVVTYSVNFITDNYMAMSVATSIMMAAQDFALVALLTYTGIFTRLANRITRTAVVLCIFAAMVDSVVFIINIFNETALKYSLNKCGGVYVLGYEGELWFGIHAIMNMVIVAFIIALLIIKCIRIPSAYWGRYIFTAAGLIVIIAFKYIFIMKAVDLRFDISIFLYALMGTMVYWNTFWYSKKNMLTVTHEMIIEHMQIPVVLFDYEGILADFNSSMKDVAGNLEYDNREQNIEWFVRENDLLVKPGEDTFEWKHNDRIYDCRIERLSDEKNRLLGTIIVMQDVSELKKAYAELENMVIYDQLTGVYSMYSFMEHCKQYDEYNGSVAVVVCDINHLSDINIQYGQKAGNQALINVAGVLKKILMDRAYIARINEGNFVAVMKNVTDAEAGKTFEQIKRTVEKECNNGKFGVTIEYGIAMRKASNRWIMDIVHEAVNDMRDRKGR